MSSICGTVDLNTRIFNFERLNAMAKALRLRGRCGSHAYIKDGVGLHSNQNNASDLFTLTRKEGSLTIVFDGSISNKEEICESLSLPHSLDSAELALRAYAALGARALSYFDGEFALAIYDERQKELLVARDKRGAKPLFYTVLDSTFIFASEIKALLCASPSCLEVECAALSELIAFPDDDIVTSDIYRNVNELPRGCFAIYSRLGLQISAYDQIATKKPIKAEGNIILSQASDFPIDKALMLSLFAFDRPAFDEYTLSYISAIDGKEGEIFIEDPRLYDNEAFALERADRLGALCGVTVRPIEKKEPPQISDSELYKIEKKLTDKACELFSSSSDSKIRALFGVDLYRRIKKTSSVSQRIRSLGMMLQSELWLCHYPVIII